MVRVPRFSVGGGPPRFSARFSRGGVATPNPVVIALVTVIGVAAAVAVVVLVR